MKADESGIKIDFTEISTDWIATAGKRCTDAGEPKYTIYILSTRGATRSENRRYHP